MIFYHMKLKLVILTFYQKKKETKVGFHYIEAKSLWSFPSNSRQNDSRDSKLSDFWCKQLY